MEIITSTQDTPALFRTPAQMKEEAGSQIVRSFLTHLNLEQLTLKSFDFGGKKEPINSVPAGIKALGQLPSLISKRIYDQAVQSQH